MRTKKGRTLHESGRILPVLADDGRPTLAYAEALALVLRCRFGGRRAAAKTVMGWTGASERTVKSWFGGVSGPSGEHLIGLARHSDDVFALLVRLTGRDQDDSHRDLRAIRQHLSDAITAIDVAIVNAGDAGGPDGSRR